MAKKALRLLMSATVWLLAAGGAGAATLWPPQNVLYSGVVDAAPDPVDANEGGYYFDLPLLELGGPLDLGFRLDYRSTRGTGMPIGDIVAWGKWWWHPKCLLQDFSIGGTNGFQFQIDGGEAIAFTRNPDDSFSLVDAGTFGVPGSDSPVDYQLKGDTNWLYLLDPSRGRVLVFNAYTNGRWRVAAAVDRNGNQWTYTYDPAVGDLKPTRVADDAGRSLDFQYGPNGMTNVSDHAGRSVQLVYELAAPDNHDSTCLRFVVDAAGRTNRFDYTWTTDSGGGYDNHLVAAHALPAGNVPWQQAYTAVVFYAEDPYEHTAVAEQTDAYGHALSFRYDTNAHAMAVAWPDGGSNRYASAGRHLPVAEIDAPGGAQTTFAVDGRSRIAGMTDATGAGIGFGFDPTNALISSVTNGAGAVLRFEYAATEQEIANPVAPGEAATFTFHQLAAIRYPDGTSEEFSYDGRGNVTGAVDRAGQATAFAYDGRGNLTERTAPGGGTATFEYDAASRLVTAVDADGATNRFEYDALDRATNVVDAAGNATAYEYDAAGRLLRAVHPDGLETLFAYDANGNRLETTARDGAVAAAAYDLMDRVAAATNALGGTTAYAYDAMGRVAEAVGPDGVANRYQYDPAGRVTNETRAGVSVAAAYDGEGRLVSRTSGRGFEETFGYDADGRLAAATNALGDAVRFGRDAAGRVTNVVDELGHATAYAYEDGRPTARTDAAGRTVQWDYDADGRLAVATDSAGGQTTFGYTSAGRLAAVTNARGAASAYEYDEAGRLARATDPLGRNTAYEYDEMGWVSLITDAASNEWGFAIMDAVGMSLAANPLGGQVTTISLPGGYPAMRFDNETDPWTYQWDAAGRLVETADPLTNVTTFAYDDFGRVAAVTNPLGHAVGFEYDADGNRVRTVDPLGAETRWAYDALGQITSVVDRVGGEAAYEYDAAGRRVRATDADGVAVETDHDATGRPLVRRAGAEAWTNAYDAAGRLASVASPLGHVQTLRRDALGRVTNAVDAAGGVAAYEYDAAGRLVAETDAEGRATAYEYDLLDGLARVTLNGGGSAAYERDALGNVVRITDLASNEWTRAWTPMGRWLEDVDPLDRTNACERDGLGRVARRLRADGSTVDVRYDAAGQVTGRVYSAGLTLSYEYDAAGRLAAADGVALARDGEGRATNALVNGRNYAAAWTPGGRLASVAYADGAFAVAYAYDPVSGRLATVSDALTGTQVAFAYDADGRLVRQTDSHGGTNEFTYDAAGRVTRIQSNPGMDLQYVYDAAGRLVSETRDVPKPAGALLANGADTNQFDAAAQLATPSAAYDDLGRRTADDRHAYAWRADGRLAAVDGVTNQYDAFGNVTARDGQPLACHPALGAAPLVDDGTNWYVWTPGGVLLYVVAQAEGHAVHHYRFDYSGNAVALVDAGGAVAEAYAYEPGGLELDPAPSALGNPFRFLGRYGIRAEGTGDLYHVRARWYDARTRAFLSPEPLWPQTANPHALNPYQYANADPVNFADVDGLEIAPRKDLWRKELHGNKWEEADEAPPPKSTATPVADVGRGEVAPRKDLWRKSFSENEWSEVEYKDERQELADVVPGKPLKKRGGSGGNLWIHGWNHNQWGLEDDAIGKLWEEANANWVETNPGKKDPGGSGGNLRIHGWNHNQWGLEDDAIGKCWDKVNGTASKSTATPVAENVPRGPLWVKRDLWRKDLTGNKWEVVDEVSASGSTATPVANVGRGEVMPGKDLWRKDLYENEWQEVADEVSAPKSTATPVAKVGIGEVPPSGDLWKKELYEDEWYDDPDEAPAKLPEWAAKLAVKGHLGKGTKRDTLLNLGVFQNALPPGTKARPPGNKKIKLSFDWEGGDGVLDVKPFKLGQKQWE